MSIISPITAPSHRVPRSFACRTQAAGHDAFVPPPRKSIMETKRSIPTSRGPTQRAFCRPASAWSILQPTRLSSMR